MNRKNFLKTSTGLVAATALPLTSIASPTHSASSAQSNVKNAKKIILKKSLVFGMIDEDLSIDGLLGIKHSPTKKIHKISINS